MNRAACHSHRVWPCLAAALWLSAMPLFAGTYEEVMGVLTNAGERLPGGASYERSFEALDRVLRGAGLETHVQTFDTLVPRTTRCRLTVGGQDVESVFPINQGTASLVTDSPIAGPLLWLGDGSLEAMRGKDIEGCVAVLDFDDPQVTFEHVFPKGARAVVLVGGGRASRWGLSRLACEGPAAIPCVFVPAAAAERHRLREADGRPASIDVNVSLRDVKGKNLWVEIPGKPGVTFKLGREEAVVLSASLDTYGVVPDQCPQERVAANAALLADVMVRLATNPAPNRSLFAVFLGAGNWDQEAARHFYYALGVGTRLFTDESIADRLAFSRAELEQTANQLRSADQPDLLESRAPHATAFVQRLRAKLVGWVNNANADLRLTRIERSEVLRRDGASKGPRDPARLAELEATIVSLNARKVLWNGLREQIAQRRRVDEGPEGAAAFAGAVEAVKGDLRQRQDELTRAIEHLQSTELLAARFDKKALVAHFDFDFARDDAPWFLSALEDTSPFTTQDPAVGSLLLHLSQIGAVYRDIRDPAWAAPLLESALTPFYPTFSLGLPVERSVPTAVSAMVGIPGSELMTVGDPLSGDGLPDRQAAPGLQKLAPQMAAFAAAAANREELSLRQPFPSEPLQEALLYRFTSGQSYEGIQAVTYSRGSTDVEGPARNAVARLTVLNRPRTAGVNRYAVARVNAAGYLYMPMMSRKVTKSAYLSSLSVFGYDGEGRLDRVSMTASQGIDSPRLGMFYLYGGASFSYGFPPDSLGSELYQPRTIDARTDAPFRTSASVASAPLGAFYTDRPGRIKQIGGKGELLLGSTADKPNGLGVELDPTVLLHLDGVQVAARDAWHLNESRLKALRERGSVNDDLESIHADANEHMELAEEARKAKDPLLQQAHAIYATCLENRIYGPLRGIADDLVQAVVLLLLLNIPFALAMERLIFGFTSIYKQVTGVAAFFLATFGLLFVTHPAFSLASAPIIVFLAFVIILLSAITTKLVLEKINKEIRAMQGLASKVHGRDDESGTIMAAILIGVSGMRNRPLKTLLTAVTVILLTFTILAFASLKARLGVVSRDMGKGGDEDRIELHRFSYAPIDGRLAQAVDALGESRFKTVRRGWVFERVIYNPANGKTAGVGAVLGTEPEESAVHARMSTLLPEFTNWTAALPPLYLPASVAEKLEVAPGTELRMNGFPFLYAGPFNAAAVQAIETIDDTRILPPDFETTSRNMGKEGPQNIDPKTLEDLDRGSFAWFSPDRVAMTGWDVLVRYYPGEAALGYLVLYPQSGEVDIEKTGTELAKVFQGAVHVKSANGARKLFFATEIEGSGFGEVIIPLLLGGLIIFSSLMGSIVDREREIYTYSAMGLSPPSVGALFFAESAIYSVVGGMGGYLLGQVAAKIAVWLGERGLCTPPPMNFSSLTSVLTIFVVMGVVLLSTVYPAMKAGRSANPGVARRWKMPEPKGNRLDFVFPFTVSQADFVGILSFIREFFENHADATLGGFSARNVEIIRAADAADGQIRFGIAADISLAPFDLGIFQRFRMVSRAFEIKGIDEVVVEIERVAGTPSAWRRANRAFADELREQFLLWRSLPIDTVEHYRRETEKEFGHKAG